MGELKDQISEQIKQAMKQKDKARLNTLRYLKKLFIENDTSTKPIPELEIVISYAKKVKDSLTLYPDGPQRFEIETEIKILSEFMPAQLSEAEVTQIISEIKFRLENPNMGSVMKELSPKIKGRFDGKKASDMVKEALKSN